jgi:hypothetical protein
MTAKSRSALKSAFETGDIPDGTDYADLIDSFLNLSDTTAQTVTSDISLGAGITFSQVTAAVSASASANTYIKISYNGKEYGLRAWLISS